MELERRAIERTDFSAARRGHDPDEVDRHLREIAEAVEEGFALGSPAWVPQESYGTARIVLIQERSTGGIGKWLIDTCSIIDKQGTKVSARAT